MKNKGQAIAQIVMWGAGIIASSAFAFTGFVNSKVASLEDKNTAVVQRITITETESKQYREDIREIKMLLKELNEKIK